ncbi:MAG: HD domain-containing phosphohydrolase [Thermodesulfobacteriota bacterium]
MKKQAEEILPNQVALEKIAMSISTQLIHLGSDELDRGIHTALQTVGEATGADHGYLYLFSDDRAKLSRTHWWCGLECKMQIDGPREWCVQDFPWIQEQIEKGQVVHIPGIGDPPPGASIPKEIFPSQGCRSFILIPLMSGKPPAGILGFESVKAEKTWPEEMIGPLRLVGEIFINALERRRIERELKKIEEKYRNLVENINDIIFSLDIRGCFTYISPVIEQVALYKVDEMMGQPFAYFLLPEELPEFLNYLQQTLAGLSQPHDFRILNKEGSIREVRISSRRLLEGDQPVGLTGMMSDVTDRKWAELLLRRAEEKYRSIFANAVEGIFQSTLDGQFLVANPACARILGYAFPEELTLPDTDVKRQYFVDPEHYREFRRLVEEGHIVKGYETQVYRKDGSKIWISMNALAIHDSNGTVLFYEGTMEDITERKWVEDQIRYLSFHDKLTGLYNRAYFEEELKRLDTERQLPISVIMGDVNGLKLVNDAFGHQEGDKLLTRVSAILRESCRKEDVIARLGGDEFAIFLPRTSYEESMAIVERIKLAGSQVGQYPEKPSIALGAVTKKEPSQDIQKILKEAEERMYRSKLLENKKVRDSIISSLRRTLFERSHESEEHAYRLRELALQLGHTLGLSDSELDQLSLLAILHDIGKIAIPEGIIIKPGDLSPEEWAMIWKHPETGYRIAGSSPELAPIAEAILAHHEWWDGNGYPRGLKGEEIPLISRIIAVVEAYDVMTHVQPYKKAVSKEEALQELRKKAGIQFDPQLTDRFTKIVSSE